MTDRSTRRGSFGPTVLLGLASATLAAVAGTRTWVVDSAAAPTGDPVPGIDVSDPVAAAGEAPVALALALVALAAWGVVLVTRGRVRRAVAVLALLSSVGLLAAVVTAAVTLPEQVSAAVREQGAEATTGFSAWFWVAALAAAASVVATLTAVLRAPQWPEMGSRYDAPATEPGPARPPAQRSNLDLWKSMDEGHDPTA